MLGIKIVLFIAWYLQLDRQMEHVNQKLDQYF